jgi:hypothetical protein
LVGASLLNRMSIGVGAGRLQPGNEPLAFFERFNAAVA